jgi:hypothetical protein
MSFFRALLAPFRRDHEQAVEDGRRTSQSGPFATGASMEAQTLTSRRRTFWRRDNGKRGSGMEGGKDGKPERAQKLGTIVGVFIPTTLNVLSILMYLRVNPLLPPRRVLRDIDE